MFKYGSSEYSLKDFYNQFGADLPQLVIVKQGYCGENEVDTLGSGQVILIHAVHTQSRVIARENSAAKRSDDHLICLPVDYSMKFSVVHSHASDGSPKSLRKIVRETTFPIHVKFSKHETVTFYGPKYKDDLGNLLLLNTYENMYFLANDVNRDTGHIWPETVSIPLYLPMVLLIPAIGILHQPWWKWDEYFSYMQQCIRKNISNGYRNLGNPDVAIYTNFDIDNTDMSTYAYLEPLYFTRPSTHVYETLACVDRTSNPRNVGTQQPITKDIRLSSHSFTEVSDKKSPNDEISGNIIHNRSKLGQIQNSENLNSNSLERIKMSENETMIGNTARSELPPLSLRNIPITYMVTSTEKSKSIENEVGMEIPHIKGKTSHQQSRGSPKYAMATSLQNRPSVNERDTKYTEDMQVDKHVSLNVGNLTVNDVIDVLETLNLSQYSDSFKSNVIDGIILKELNQDILMIDLGFTRIEAIRLTNYVETGRGFV